MGMEMGMQIMANTFKRMRKKTERNEHVGYVCGDYYNNNNNYLWKEIVCLFYWYLSVLYKPLMYTQIMRMCLYYECIIITFIRIVDLFIYLCYVIYWLICLVAAEKRLKAQQNKGVQQGGGQLARKLEEDKKRKDWTDDNNLNNPNNKLKVTPI